MQADDHSSTGAEGRDSDDPTRAVRARRLQSSAHSPAQVLARAESWRAGGHGVALATVVKTWGSSPRPAGSQMVVRDDGLFLGSVSGGCVEGRVIQEATEMLKVAAAPPRRLEFGVRNDEAWEVGLACGGRVEIFVELVE